MVVTRVGLAMALMVSFFTHCSGHVVVAHRDHTPAGFTMGPPAKPERVLSFDVFVRQPNEEKLLRLAAAVSDPDHELYGKHMTPTALKTMMQPTAEDVEKVVAWVTRAGGSTHQVCADAFTRGSKSNMPHPIGR